MLKVGQLIRFVTGLNPQNSPAKLSFYNFLRGFPKPDQSLTPELIDMFFDYCLDYPHWAANKNQLGNEVQYLLENFNDFHQRPFDLSKIRFPQSMQLLEIERQQDLMEVLSIYLKRLYSEKCKFRLINDQNKRMIALILHEDRSLSVRTFDRKFTLRDGHLEPLRRDLVLHYTPELEMSSEHVHKIEVAPYIIAEFQIAKGRVTGALLRGYVFQKLVELRGDLLEEQQRLMIPIKRLEQFFVDRSTDTYYQDLISQIERTLALIQQGDREAAQWGSRILTQAETALENIFLGDKLLTLLVRDLRRSTGGPRASAISPVQPQEETREEWHITPPTDELDLIN